MWFQLQTTSLFSSQFVLGDSNHDDHVLPFSIILGVFTHDDHISVLSIVSLDFCHCNVILSSISFIHGSFGFLLLRLKWTNFNKWMNFTTKRELNLRQTWTICTYEKTSFCVSKKTNFGVHKKTNLRVLTSKKVYVSRNILCWATFNKIETHDKQLFYKRGKFWKRIQIFFLTKTFGAVGQMIKSPVPFERWYELQR